MLLAITTTTAPATDLGFLLHKHPSKVQAFDLTFGRAHVFYAEATEQRCSAVLLLDVDSVGLVRGRRGPAGDGFLLQQYVNDRPYVASSFLSVAVAQVYGSALGGRCAARPELVETVLELEARLSAVPCRGGEGFLRSLFEPLGYRVCAQRHALDPAFPSWGASAYFDVTLRGQRRLQDLLSHLYVLIPVLDNDKHYWVGQDELEKLLRHGEGWLAAHPQREAIALRYLKHQRGLTHAALARLSEEGAADPDEVLEEQSAEEAAWEQQLPMAATATEAEALLAAEAEPANETAPPEHLHCAKLERGPSLHSQRLGAVLAALRASGARSVLDLGCGEGRLLQLLLRDKQFDKVVGMDVSARALEMAVERLRLERMPAAKRSRLTLLHGSLVYRDTRLAGFDAAVLLEVIEHLDAGRLAAFERVLLEFARPRTVIITTPNREYNALWPALPAGRLRHRDHRFEWRRAEFAEWAESAARRHGYRAAFLPVGPQDPTHGPPTQMATLTLESA